MFGRKNAIIAKLMKENAELKDMLKNADACIAAVKKDLDVTSDSVDYTKALELLNAELADAKSRQKAQDSPPSKYMQGIMRAIELIGTLKPHTAGGAS